jgi:hypothetical protein
MSNLFYEMNFEKYFEKIKNNEHFKYSRYNDGELIAVIGNSPNQGNCDGHQYFPQMGIELKSALLNYKENDNYPLESFKYWYDTLPHIKKIIDELKILNPELTFMDNDFIRIPHERNPEQFLRLFEELKSKDIVIIGPKYLGKLKKFFDFDHIEIPLKNCYLQKNEIIWAIDDLNKERKNKVFLFSTSMAANIIIDEFRFDMNNTYLDWGSVWDTFFVSAEYNFIRKRSTSNLEKYKTIYKDYLI